MSTGQFINGDCLNEMKYIPENSVDLIFTSPPYADQIKDYGKSFHKIKPDNFNKWFYPYSLEMFRILKPTGSFVLNISDKIDGIYQSIFVYKLVIMLIEKAGFHLVRDYIWYNPATPPNIFSRGKMGRTKKSHEYCFWFSKSKKWTFNMDAIRKPYSPSMCALFAHRPQGDRSQNIRPSGHSFNLSHTWKDNGGADPGSVITISNTSSNDTFHRMCKELGIKHPARFPLKLAEFFIKAGTNEGDTVLDPFGGSGTVAIASERLHRKFIYIDINPNFCRMAKEWFQIELHPDSIYQKNLDNFFNQVITKCKWDFLPFAFVYDLYTAWLKETNLFEKKQTKKVFYDRLIKYLINDKDWKVTKKSAAFINLQLKEPEDLIAKFKLIKWGDIDIGGKASNNSSNVKVKTSSKGIERIL